MEATGVVGDGAELVVCLAAEEVGGTPLAARLCLRVGCLAFEVLEKIELTIIIRLCQVGTFRIKLREQIFIKK